MQRSGQTYHAQRTACFKVRGVPPHLSLDLHQKTGTCRWGGVRPEIARHVDLVTLNREVELVWQEHCERRKPVGHLFHTNRSRGDCKPDLWLDRRNPSGCMARADRDLAERCYDAVLRRLSAAIKEMERAAEKKASVGSAA